LFVTYRSCTMVRRLWIVCLICTIILWSTLGNINGTINPGGLIVLVVSTFLCHKKEMGMMSK
jgi:hypothetical protein